MLEGLISSLLRAIQAHFYALFSCYSFISLSFPLAFCLSLPSSCLVCLLYFRKLSNYFHLGVSDSLKYEKFFLQRGNYLLQIFPFCATFRNRGKYSNCNISNLKSAYFTSNCLIIVITWEDFHDEDYDDDDDGEKDEKGSDFHFCIHSHLI